MSYLLRKFVFLLALAVAAGPVMAKDSSDVSKKSKLKTGLFSKKKAISKKTTAKKKTTASKKRKSTASASEGKSQYKNMTININKASASALSAYLVGIGPVKAMAIVDFREKNGRFTSLKDLMKVEGVGEATFDGLKKNVSTSRGTTVAPEGYKMEKVTKKKGSTKKKRTTSSSSNSKRKTTSTSSRKSSSDSDSGSKSKKLKTTARKAKSTPSSSSTTSKKKTKAKKPKAKKKASSKKKTKKKDK